MTKELPPLEDQQRFLDAMQSAETPEERDTILDTEFGEKRTKKRTFLRRSIMNWILEEKKRRGCTIHDVVNGILNEYAATPEDRDEFSKGSFEIKFTERNLKLIENLVDSSTTTVNDHTITTNFDYVLETILQKQKLFQESIKAEPYKPREREDHYNRCTMIFDTKEELEEWASKHVYNLLQPNQITISLDQERDA